MKNLIAFIGFTIAILSCVVESRVVLDVPYGEHEDQILDLHIPDDDSIRINKIIIMLHGGAWWMGRKEDLNPHVAVIREKLPDYAIANMNYQLGSAESPGFPKQLDDIKAVIAFLKSSFTTDLSIAVFGNSAGALLALLYSYRWDQTSRPDTCQENPALWNETSPITFVDERSPPTVGFNGSLDVLVPFGQMASLEEKLDSVGVPNAFARYPIGQTDWPDAHVQDMFTIMADFLTSHLWD
ncbi:Kynurenine formamidase [Folsomia candida]|uniref:Kynurenine formamidase n=1 Tax=Folsomia candida TaxID=158441 RepID=A0A226E9X4_FOLCA|nr:Kynurenine formamidase [Folsomia candida]